MDGAVIDKSSSSCSKIDGRAGAPLRPAAQLRGLCSGYGEWAAGGFREIV